MKYFSQFLDFLAPQKCVGCKTRWLFLCENCISKQRLNEAYCYICKQKSVYFKIHEQCKKWFFLDAVIIAYHYNNSFIKTSLHEGKFYKKKDILSQYGKILSWFFSKHLAQNKTKVFSPIPLHFLRQWKRGYNQSEILAKTLSWELQVPYQNTLKKTKHTRHQSHLSRTQRLDNINNCFQIRKRYQDKLDKDIYILIDDVVSTGTTLNEAAKILKQNGAKQVIACVIASD
jgi:competence protein ComFC